MTQPPDPLSRLGAEEWLRQPEVQRRSEPPPGVFEVALSLGGTVSAGAYTSGVLDFLVEALDQWDAARGQSNVPLHRVQLRAISGTSGGGVCGATLAKSLAHRFEPERIADPFAMPNPVSTNPLYRSWVLGFDLEQMCRVPDAQTTRPDAILHPGPASNPIDAPYGPPRRWAFDPLTVLLALTNLTGVPYRISYTGDASRGLSYSRHVDYARLEFFYRGSKPGTLCWPDAIRIKAHPDADPQGHPAAIEQSWDEVWSFARATSAFPVVFPVVELQRPAWHHLYQPVVTPRFDGDGAVSLEGIVPQPAWNEQGQHPTGPYRFVAADGGILNNIPVELAHRELAGVVGHDSLTGNAARRAVIHVDPLGNPARGRASADLSITQIAGASLSTLVSHARFSMLDTMVADEPAVNTRFLVSPVRTEAEQRIEGAAAVAAGAIGGFSGFLSVAFRHHDFMLGRRNCQQFLLKHFRLAANNPSFKNVSGNDDVQIIPLLGTAAIPQPQPLWPAARYWPVDATRPLRTRLSYLLQQVLPGVRTRWLLGLVLLLPKGIAARLLACALASRGVERIRTELLNHGLSNRVDR